MEFSKSIKRTVIMVVLFIATANLIGQEQKERHTVKYPEKIQLLDALNDLMSLNICLNFDHNLVKDIYVSGT